MPLPAPRGVTGTSIPSRSRSIARNSASWNFGSIGPIATYFPSRVSYTL